MHYITARLWMVFIFSFLSSVGVHDLSMDLRDLMHLNKCSVNVTSRQYLFQFHDPERLLCILDEPCKNDAKCEELADGYICHCTAGFKGQNCTGRRNQKVLQQTELNNSASQDLTEENLSY